MKDEKEKDFLTFFWKKESKTKKTGTSGPKGRWRGLCARNDKATKKPWNG